MTSRRGSRNGVYDPTLSVRTPPAIRKALGAFAASKEMTLSGAANAILSEWLRTHGWLAGSGPKPTGPATNAVDAMDSAIEKDRKG